jgi:LysR family transcriptional regulator, nitrogen assimilation regulatory protein
MVEFRELRYFVKVAEYKSFSKAAEILHIAQPALSRQIKKLEAEFGVELFFRHARGVELTEAGVLLEARARSLFLQMKEIADEVASCAERPSGIVQLGVSAAPGTVLIPKLANEIRRLFPGITLRIVEGYGSVVQQWLARGEIDIAIIPDPGAEANFEVRPLVEDDLIAIGPEGSHIPVVQSYSLEEIAALPLILPDDRHRYRQVIDRAFKQRGLTANLQFETEGIEIMLSMVRQGLGYAIVAYPLVYNDRRLRVIPITPKHSIPMRWVTATSTERGRVRAVGEVIKLAASVARDIVEQGLWPGNPRTFEKGRLPAKTNPRAGVQLGSRLS